MLLGHYINSLLQIEQNLMKFYVFTENLETICNYTAILASLFNKRIKHCFVENKSFVE